MRRISEDLEVFYESGETTGEEEEIRRYSMLRGSQGCRYTFCGDMRYSGNACMPSYLTTERPVPFHKPYSVHFQSLLLLPLTGSEILGTIHQAEK
jgi:hypothetical protein